MTTPDPIAFIRANLPVAPVPTIPEISLHQAAPHSGVGRLAGGAGEDPAPYWAYLWAGGLALARFLLDRPETVAGRGVFDLGAGSGLVAIAAMKAGAREAIAMDIDPYAVAAIGVNAALNGVAVSARCGDPIAGAAAPAIVLVGDLFYNAPLARRVTVFLDRCVAAGATVLVGDPWRRPLPRERLTLLAGYEVAETGGRTVRSGVFDWRAAPSVT